MTRARNARTLTPAHLKASINAESQFSFLRDMVAAIPDFQTSLDEEPLVSCDSASTPSAPVQTRSRLRPPRLSCQVPRGSAGRGRSRRSARDAERIVADEDDEAEEMEEEEDEDLDESSSCDNYLPPTRGALLPPSTASPVAPLPLASTAAAVIDDDYDAE